jgi:ATP adenylyltransferase
MNAGWTLALAAHVRLKYAPLLDPRALHLNLRVPFRVFEQSELNRVFSTTYSLFYWINYMETIFAPWRMEYIKGEKPDGCVFCKCSIRCDEYVIYDGKSSFVMMNRYPYVSGHLMIIPYRHIGKIENLNQEERNEIFALLDSSVKVLQEAMNPDGFNIGMNIGKAAGAGIEEHIHVHIIPRWEGDTNFMSVVNDVRVIPENIQITAAKLVPLYKKYHQEG